MNAEQQQALFDNTARGINGAPPEVVQRHIDNCTRCDPAYGEGVSSAAIAAL